MVPLWDRPVNDRLMFDATFSGEAAWALPLTNGSAKVHCRLQRPVDLSHQRGRQNADPLGQLGAVKRGRLMANSKARLRQTGSPAGNSTTVGLRLPCAAEVDIGTRIMNLHAGAR